jgi:hypothetical protein
MYLVQVQLWKQTMLSAPAHARAWRQEAADYLGLHLAVVQQPGMHRLSLKEKRSSS